MKKALLLQTCIFAAIIFCQNVNAQIRIKNNHILNEGGLSSHRENNVVQSSFQTALSGYYFEGFEGTFPPAGWQIVDVLDSTSGWTTSTIADFPAAFEGLQSSHCKYSATGSGDDWFIAPKFTVASGDSLSFQFKFEYHGYPPDSTFILISTTDSAITSFTNIIDFIADTVTVPNTVLPIWTYYTYSLNGFAGQDIYVAFRNKNTLGDGIFIDNLELGTRPDAEAAVKTIDMDNYYPSGTSNPKASVKNNGAITQTFNVTMTIIDDYSSTKTITLAPQETAQISFDPWNATVGNYTVIVQTLLADDANSANDTLSKFITVLEPFLNYGWSTHDPLPQPIIGGAAVSVCSNDNSRYFIIGGIDANFLTEGFEYDLAFNTWSSISPLLLQSGYAGAVNANGKIFLFSGGNTSNGDPNGATQIYNYNTDTWSLGTPMPTPAGNFATSIYKDSLVYIIGGNIGNAVGCNLVQIYNTYTDSWSAGTNKPGLAVYAIRAGIVGNKIVVAGGYDPIGAVAIGTTYIGEINPLNPTQITWSQGADHPAGKISRQGAGVSLDKNSSIVVFTGGTNTNTFSTTTAGTFGYDVNSNSWKLGPNKPTALNLFYMTPVLQNDSIYLAALGGGDGVNGSDKNEWLNLGFYQIPTVIQENNLFAEINLFPNPASDETTLMLHLKKAAHARITVKNIMGVEVSIICDKTMQAGNNAVSISTKNLSNGMYFCMINVDGKSISKKFIKN
jgi:hypothetical protein